MRELRPLRVAILADYLDEGWPSMDLVADQLIAELRRAHAGDIAATLIRPAMPRRLRRLSSGRRAAGLDRVIARMWDYPRQLRGTGDFDVFHLVDHSYSQLLHALPARRAVVTCHDIDTFRSVVDAGNERRTPLFRAMTRRILSGFRSAGHVACTTEATRRLVVEQLGFDGARATVVHNGVDPCCTPEPQADADDAARRLLGAPGTHCDLLHVGSTIPRKRIEDLLRTVSSVARQFPPLRLVRVGGAFTPAQAELARELRIDVAVMPFVDRATLAAIYRRSALLLLPSEREGFGLPLVEALACGLPAVVSNIEALREVGGDAATYCPVAEPAAWAATVGHLLRERDSDPEAWRRRQARAVARASGFSWAEYARKMAGIYRDLSRRAGAAC